MTATSALNPHTSKDNSFWSISFNQDIYPYLIMCHVDSQHCSVILSLYLFYLRPRVGTKLQLFWWHDGRIFWPITKEWQHPYSGERIMSVSMSLNSTPLLHPYLNFQYILSSFSVWEYILCYFIPLFSFILSSFWRFSTFLPKYDRQTVMDLDVAQALP